MQRAMGLARGTERAWTRARETAAHRGRGGGGGGGVRAARARARASASANEREILRETTTKIRECAKRGAANAAVDLLVSLNGLGATPDARATSATLTACVNGRDVELARRVYDEIFEKGVAVPDEVAVAEMAKGYLSLDPPSWGQAMSVVNGAKDRHGIELTSVTYNALLSCCTTTNDLARAEEIVDRMVDEGVAPDMWTVSAVQKRRSIRAYVKKMLLV